LYQHQRRGAVYVKWNYGGPREDSRSNLEVPGSIYEATLTVKSTVVSFDTSFGTSIPNDLHVWVVESHLYEVESPME
jgi:hypothetical protein